MNCPSYNYFFEAMSPKIRIKIVQALRKKPLSVTEICTAINEEQSKVSHNLKRMTDCHFLEVKQVGKNRVYSLNSETLLPLLKIVEKHVQNYCCNSCSKRKTK